MSELSPEKYRWMRLQKESELLEAEERFREAKAKGPVPRVTKLKLSELREDYRRNWRQRIPGGVQPETIKASAKPGRNK